MISFRDRPSPNFDSRPDGAPIDMLVLHYTGMRTAAAALDRLTDPEARVSAHYVIEEDGTVWRLVDEKARAWHAGISAWRGETDINGRSVGIELVNPGHELGYRPFPGAQIEALIGLAKRVLARHPIPPRNVVGHADIAPVRKMDPGELFDWPRLAAAGIGLWPADGQMAGPEGHAAELGGIGYDTADLSAAVTAFQRRFRPSSIDGEIDAETGRLIGAVHRLATGPRPPD